MNSSFKNHNFDWSSPPQTAVPISASNFNHLNPQYSYQSINNLNQNVGTEPSNFAFSDQINQFYSIPPVPIQFMQPMLTNHTQLHTNSGLFSTQYVPVMYAPVHMMGVMNPNNHQLQQQYFVPAVPFQPVINVMNTINSSNSNIISNSDRSRNNMGLDNFRRLESNFVVDGDIQQAVRAQSTNYTTNSNTSNSGTVMHINSMPNRNDSNFTVISQAEAKHSGNILTHENKAPTAQTIKPLDGSLQAAVQTDVRKSTTDIVTEMETVLLTQQMDKVKLEFD